MRREGWRTLFIGTVTFLATSGVRYTPLVTMTPRMRVVTVLLDTTVAVVCAGAWWKWRRR